MPQKILVVDDEELLEYVFKQHFRQRIRAKDLEFLFANNGKQALEQLQNNPDIEVVLTDINMPEMDGLTLLSHLQEIDATLKAIVVSAYGDLSNIRTAMNRGAFDFLTKPIDFKDLEITIQRGLTATQQTRENLRQLQETQMQLMQSDKMASMGQLVAGVAHEINNPVGFILGNLNHAEGYFQELIKILQIYEQKYAETLTEQEKAHIEEVELDYILEDLPQLLKSMKEGTDRIRHLSASLRTFSRSDSISKVAFDIHTGLDSTLMILKYRLKASEIRPDIQTLKEYGDVPNLNCYPGQLNQVFMNLIANAIDAFDEFYAENPGAKNNTKPKIKICTLISEEGSQMAIRIADNGPGMTSEVQRRVFDHLFTTKPAGKGTGLGLYISRQIIEEKHGGKLSFISSPGEGTEFCIEIPLNSPV